MAKSRPGRRRVKRAAVDGPRRTAPTLCPMESRARAATGGRRELLPRGPARTSSARCCEQLSAARPPPEGAAAPKALIVPHAGYVYSGPVAATAYAALRPLRGKIERVVLLGPSHHVPLRGLAVPDAEAFATPLGVVELDARRRRPRARPCARCAALGAAHECEHSLEVQLPFLQLVLGSFRLVPLAVGDARDDEVAEVLEALWGGSETLDPRELGPLPLPRLRHRASSRRRDLAGDPGAAARRPGRRTRPAAGSRCAACWSRRGATGCARSSSTCGAPATPPGPGTA